VNSAGTPPGGPRSITVPRRIALGIALLYALFGSLWIVASDRLLPDLGMDAEDVMWLGTAKGLLFVLVTSAVLYVLMRVTPREPEEGWMPQARGGLLSIVFLCLAGAILLIGYQVQRQHVQSIEERNYSALRSTTFIKAQRVGEWYGDQVDAVTAIGRMYADGAAGLLPVDESPQPHRDLLERLAPTARLLGLDAVVVAGADGRVLLAHGLPPRHELLERALDAAAGREIGFSGAAAAGDGAMQAALAYRLGSGLDAAADPTWLVAVFDPGPRLYSILQRWPLAGTSGETSLASLGPDGELVFLPGFEAPVSGGRQLAFPTRTGEPGSGYALRGEQGVIEGFMPDGRSILLTMSRVPGVHWIVVGAIDRDEVYAGAASLLRNTALVVLVAVLIAGWLILALFRQQQLLNRALLESARRERDVLDQHFSYLTRFANDIVLLMDAEGRILNCNDRALSAYGYTREELIGRNTLELRPPALKAAGRRQLSIVKQEGGLVFETWHRRRDGSEFPVESSVRSFEVDGEIFIQGIVRDITERTRAEEALRRSEARFRNIFDHTAVGLAHVSVDGRFLMVNPRFAELLGYSPEELESMTVWEISLPEDLPRELPLGEAVMAGERDDFTLEKRYRRKDGTVFWAQLKASAVREESGKVEYLVGVIEDIGPRKRLQAQLKRRNKLYRTLSETNRAIARIRDLDELLPEACRIAVTHASLPLAAVACPTSAGPVLVASAGPDVEAFATQLLAAPAPGDVFAFPDDGAVQPGIIVVNDVEAGPVSAGTRLACLRRGVRGFASFPLGSGRKPEARLAVFSREPGYFEGDTLALLSDMARDLTLGMDRAMERAAREQAEVRLREAASRMSALIEAAPVPVFGLDSDGQVLDVWNPAAERVFGWRREEVVGKRLPIVPEDKERQAEFDALCRKVLGGDDFLGLEASCRRRDGSTGVLSVSASRITTASGVPGVMVVAEDITARHEAMEALRAARDELEQRVAQRTAELAAARDRAEEADRIKTEFLANISHELRTPLNSIIGFSSLLLSGAPGTVNDEQEKQLTIVRRAGERLLAVIEDILDISRLQASETRLPCEPTPLRDMVLRVADAMRGQAIGRGIEIRTEIESCITMAEPRRLEQVVRNLVSNAVKYTEQGEVTIRCRQLDGRVEIAVEDTGCGISAEQQARLFVPFALLGSGEPGQPGAGLGLAISRRLVEAMGGSISVDSTPGQGSVFTVRLDAA
jgi:PAS domain S-box-containing protein